MREVTYNKKIMFKCDEKQTAVFILAEQCTEGEKKTARDGFEFGLK